MNNKIVEIAKKELGYKEQNKWTKFGKWYEHKFPNTSFAYSAWCQMFISWCAEQSGIGTDIIPLTASCPIAYNFFKKKGRIVTDVKVGDIIFFTWNGSKNADHVGIVYMVNGNSFTTIEGNKNDRVETRDVTLGNPCILAICRPNYSILSEPIPIEQNTYIVKKGDTLSKIADMFNTTYQVLASYNGILNPNKISVGQVINIPTTNVTVVIPSSRTYIVTPRIGVNVRQAPNIFAKRVNGYGYGRKVVIFEQSNGWGRCNEGWIKMSNLK